MSPRRRASRVYWRTQGGERRAYGDFRDFADVGGGREALMPPGAVVATVDPDLAAELATRRLRELERRRKDRTLLGSDKSATLQAFAAHHLLKKAKGGQVTHRWLLQAEQKLEAAVEYFGPERDLRSIRVEHVQAWTEVLLHTPGGRGGRPLSPGTVRHYLNALSHLYSRAASEGYVDPGFNPVGAMMEKPTPRRREARWLEAHDAALFLEAARLYRPQGDGVVQAHGGALSARANPHLHPILATFLLTGGRASEVLGLEVDDVSFHRRTITFRPNRWRGLKTRTSHRSVPLWPQLEAILRDYLVERERTGGLGSLLFPSARGEEGMVTDLRKALDAIGARAGWNPGEVRTKAFRHTYCAARLQTLDRGHPVSPWTVARELGHGGTSMVEKVYGHLGEVRWRAEEVAFRVEDHQEVLGGRLRALQEGV